MMHSCTVLFVTHAFYGIMHSFKHRWVVTQNAKTLAWLVVILMNLFFVYFCIISGMTREFGWQRGYVLACLLQLVIEVLVYETSECMWVHYGLPRLVSDDVDAIIRGLNHTIDAAFSSANHAAQALDMPSYFFVSTLLAEQLPLVLESSIVLSYHSKNPPPGGVHYRWQKGKARKNSLISRLGATAVLTSILQAIASSNIRVQKMVLHTLQPIAVSFIFVAWAYMSRNVIYLVVAIVLVLLIVSVTCARPCFVKNKIRSDSPDIVEGVDMENGFSKVASDGNEKGLGAIEMPSSEVYVSQKDKEIATLERSPADSSAMIPSSPNAGGLVTVQSQHSSDSLSAGTSCDVGRMRLESISEDDVNIQSPRYRTNSDRMHVAMPVASREVSSETSSGRQRSLSDGRNRSVSEISGRMRMESITESEYDVRYRADSYWGANKSDRSNSSDQWRDFVAQQRGDFNILESSSESSNQTDNEEIRAGDFTRLSSSSCGSDELDIVVISNVDYGHKSSLPHNEI